ncbi:MAG TPA: hypothetical protein VMF88_10705 [Bacteroidota bacterium]|nr:hypothetical protein [Bacteroidota bacterium]
MVNKIAIQVTINGGAGGLHLNFNIGLAGVINTDHSQILNINLNSGHYTIIVSGSAPSGGSVQAVFSVVGGGVLTTSPLYSSSSFVDMLSFDVP